jgi:FkbM family methyltransferase
VDLLRNHLNWQYLSWARDRFGAPFALLHYRRGLISVPTSSERTHHVHLRPGTADQMVYDEVFVSRGYDIPLTDPRFIVDAGAHIGLASVFFAIRYPRARIVAIEPEPSNFAVLERHSQLYPNITPIRAGLWRKETRLKISNPTAQTWSFRIEESDHEGLQAVTVESIMRRFGVDGIDVLKMDIEGSEVEVLNHSTPWIDKVGTLVIELHDRFKTGCTEALQAATAGSQWTRSISGESVVMTRR